MGAISIDDGIGIPGVIVLGISCIYRILCLTLFSSPDRASVTFFWVPTKGEVRFIGYKGYVR